MIQALAAHLSQSTLFAGTAWLLTLALRKNQARVRYWIWFIASAKFLIPFSLLVGLGILVPRHMAVPEPQKAWVAAAERISQPLTAVPDDAARVVVTPGPVKQNHFAAFAWALWVCGFAAITICWLARWKRVHAMRTWAIPVSIPGCIDLPVPVRSVTGLIEPGIFGIFRPVLLLPDGIEDRLDREQLDAILAHELCHVRRRDNLTATIHMAVQATFWFHPLIWWLGSRLVDERERACDEAVLRLGTRPHVYAAGILNVCRLYVESPLACVSGVTGSDLKRRIHGILSGNKPRDLSFARKAGLLMIGTSCLALPVLTGFWNAPLLKGALPLSVRAMPATTLRFSSVSITPCKTRAVQPDVANPSAGRLVLTCQWGASLIQLAYSNSGMVRPEDLLSAVSGFSPHHATLVGQRYNLDARANDEASVDLMEGPMLQALLADRFKLRVHTESRNVPMFSLSVAKSGAKLQPSEKEGCRGGGIQSLYLPYLPPGPGSNCINSVNRNLFDTFRRLDGQAISIQAFCRLLQGALRRPVIDRTGISGKFDFHVVFAGGLTPAPLAQLYKPLRDVLERQLGLRIDPSTSPLEFFVVDQVEKPIIE
jgi:bla regulator protein blaR1